MDHHLRDDDLLPLLIIDPRETSTHIDQEAYHVPDRALDPQGAIGLAPDHLPDLDLHQEDVVGEEIALDGMEVAEEEAQVIAAIVVTMIVAVAGVVLEEEEDDVEGSLGEKMYRMIV